MAPGQLGAATVRFLAERPAEWDGLVARLATTGKLLTKISLVVTLIPNAGATIRAYAKKDWWGVALLGAATIASTVAICATLAAAAPGAPLIAAIAAAASTVLMLIDIVRKYVITHTEHGDLYEDTVVAHRLLFAPRFAIVAPDPGEFTRTVGYEAGEEVVEIGSIEFAGGESRGLEGTVANWAIGNGITAMYAAAVENDDGFTVSCPFPAVAAETVEQGGGDRFVFLDDPLLTVTPRFESWIDLAADAVGEVLVQRGDPVFAGDTVAVWAGESVAADRDGIVGAVELGTDPEYVNARIRIWANVP